MSVIINLSEIKSILKNIDLMTAIEKGFVEYSNGNTVIPPIGELLFDKPEGEVHIKYGYLKEDDFFLIKIASGFYENTKIGIPSSQGMMLLFSQKTGQSEAILLDEGYLTNIRTAIAGALAAKYFAPKKIVAIGIIGTGIQAKLQLEYLQQYTSCKTVWIWGRNIKNVEKLKSELSDKFVIHIAKTPNEISKHCNIIVTTTASKEPLLLSEDILPGTHITAVGSDTSEKQELQSEILGKADIVIADSISQSKSRGEVYRAIQQGAILPEKVVELGNAIKNEGLQRSNEQQISVVDLTGVAIQDIMIAKSIYTNYKKQ
ncbi:ornithine cyclodeaminase family protein [Aquimarina aquimarini]|uniref:ornithine cyclodeaminase family protein n=1 Tax=Aquimarina aquimarini TaxID=1191734 RepID=UPI000D554C37|nr:ornithine cyclodeaminase family protein [Aquimarina aquimarini]